MGKDCGEVDWSWDNPAIVERFTKYFNDWQRQQQQKQHDLNEVGKQDFLRTKNPHPGKPDGKPDPDAVFEAAE